MKIKKLPALILSVTIGMADLGGVYAAELDGNAAEEAVVFEDEISAEEACVSDSALNTDFSPAEMFEADDVSLDSVTCGDYEYTVRSDGTAQIVGYSGNGGDIVIPSVLDGYTVTEIMGVLGGVSVKESLTSIIIPNSVTTIGEWAFSGCTNLSNVYIPSSVTSIGAYAFQNCTSLSSIDIPNITDISDHSFQNCTSLPSIDIPKSVTSIGEYAFSGCTGVLSLYIPSNVTNIGYKAFGDCTGLEELQFSDESSGTSIGECAFMDCTNLTSVTIPENIIYIGDYAFGSYFSYKNYYITNSFIIYGYNYTAAELYAGEFEVVFISLGAASENASLFTYKELEDGTLEILHYVGAATEVIVPSSINGQSVTSITWSAFEGNTDITDVIIEDGITNIENSAFYKCTNLTSVTIPGSVTTLGSIFYGCTGLKSVTILNGVTSINGTFGYCTSLTDITIPSSVTSIGGSAFSSCTSLPSIDIPSSVTSIGSWAFYGCTGLTSITISNGTIGRLAFYGCTSLTNLTLLNGVTTIGELSFGFCSSLTDLTIPSSVTSIGEEAFEYCTGLTSVTILNGATSIGEAAFVCCTGLTEITIPSSVTSLEANAFSGCTNLTSINVSEDNAVYTSVDGAVYDKEITELLLYPAGKTGSVSVPDTVTGIGIKAFYNCDNLTNLTVPSGITSIGDSAFRSCDSLTNVKLPESVTYVGDYAFYSCSSLKSITILSKTITMGSFVFDTYDKNNYDEETGEYANIDGTLEIVYCYEGSDADDASLYPDGVTIKYIDDSVTAELTLTEESDYSIDTEAGCVAGVGTGTSAADFAGNFDNTDIMVCDAEGNDITGSSALVGTGCVVRSVSDGETTDELTVVVTGDTNGDGSANVLDLVAIFDYIQGASVLDGAYLTAAYINEDSAVNVLDLSALFDIIQG